MEKPAVRQRPASAPPGRGQRKLGRTAMRWGRPTLVHKAVRSKPRAVTPLLAVARLDMDADEDDEELDVVAPARLDFGRYPAPRTDVVRTRLGGGGAEAAASVPMNRPRRSARPASADASVHRVPRPDATRQQALEDKTASAQSLAAELEEEAKTLATVSSRIAAKYTGPNRALLLPPGSQEPSGTEGLDDPREDDVDVLRGRYYLKVRGPPIDGWAAEGLATRTVKNDQWYTGRHMESGLQLVVPPPKEDHSTRRGRRRMTRRRWVSGEHDRFFFANVFSHRAAFSHRWRCCRRLGRVSEIVVSQRRRGCGGEGCCEAVGRVDQGAAELDLPQAAQEAHAARDAALAGAGGGRHQGEAAAAAASDGAPAADAHGGAGGDGLENEADQNEHAERWIKRFRKSISLISSAGKEPHCSQVPPSVSVRGCHLDLRSIASRARTRCRRATSLRSASAGVSVADGAPTRSPCSGVAWCFIFER